MLVFRCQVCMCIDCLQISVTGSHLCSNFMLTLVFFKSFVHFGCLKVEQSHFCFIIVVDHYIKPLNLLYWVHKEQWHIFNQSAHIYYITVATGRFWSSRWDTLHMYLPTFKYIFTYCVLGLADPAKSFTITLPNRVCPTNDIDFHGYCECRFS